MARGGVTKTQRAPSREEAGLAALSDAAWKAYSTHLLQQETITCKRLWLLKWEYVVGATIDGLGL